MRIEAPPIPVLEPPWSSPVARSALRVRPAKVFVNGIGRVGRVRAQRLGKVNEQA